MALTFDFEKSISPLLGKIYRPIARIFFLRQTSNEWYGIWMIVDTGADYTLLPKYLALKLGIDLQKDCKMYRTEGIGGSEKVYFLKSIKTKLRTWERNIPVGFLDRDNIPPLMGRHLFLETFETHLSKNHTVSFKE